VADDTVLALARVLKTGKLRNEDKGLLKEAEEFFTNVISGYKWSENPSISENSIQCAAALTDAINAITIEMKVGSTKQFLRYVKELRDAAHQIYEKGGASEKKVKDLQRFFTAYGYSQLEKADEIANRKGTTEASAWLSRVA
jgi:hypothetical protein